MINVIIFGTGFCSEKVYKIISDFDDFNVLAFSDNDQNRIGNRFFDKDIIHPNSLIDRTDIDYILVASQWHSQIINGLCLLGLESSKMIPIDHVQTEEFVLNLSEICRPTYAPVGENLTRVSSFPKILILSFETLNDNHGTGVLLRRYFKDFPPEYLFSISHRHCGDPWLKQSLLLSELGSSSIECVKKALKEKSFIPDVIYATALHELDLEMLNSVISAVAPGTPVIQHFMDYIPADECVFRDKFRKIIPKICKVWALTESIRGMLKIEFQIDADLVTGLIQNVSNVYKKTHNNFDANMRTVLIGNFYNHDVIGFLKCFWKECRRISPFLGPVEWFASPRRVQRLFDAENDPGIDFVWRGFYKGGRLKKRLVSADVALLPLNCGRCADSNYLRYSLPSRVGEFACLGIPVFAIASEDTPLSKFINETGIGECVCGLDPVDVAGKFIDFMSDRNRRARMGSCGRSLVENQFDIISFSKWFNNQLFNVSNISN